MNGVAPQYDIDSGSEPDRLVCTETTLAEALVDLLADQGVERAFGVSGGAIALVFDALVASSRVALHHFRHETGAAFAAAEAYFVSRKPTVVFTTTGPGTLNALTGISAARWDGAKVVLVSGATSTPQRPRWGVLVAPETSTTLAPSQRAALMPVSAFRVPGPVVVKTTVGLRLTK